MADITVNSLELYVEEKVVSAITAFYTNVRKFDDVANRIVDCADKLEDYWKGTAADIYVDKVETVYNQVIDVSDALYDIYEMLQKAQDAFYQADRSLKDSMQQSQSQGGGSSASSKGEYAAMSKGAVTPHGIAESYVPNVTLPAMNPQPVLKSTMGESYAPSFFYNAFNTVATIAHCVPTPFVIAALYANMSVKEIIAHNVSGATRALFEYGGKSPTLVQPHNVPGAEIPEFEYNGMSGMPVQPHNIAGAEVPEFEYNGMSGMPVQPHNIAGAEVPEFEYNGMGGMPVQPHNIAGAEVPEFEYNGMSGTPVQPHNIAGAEVPEFEYNGMSSLPVRPHDIDSAKVDEFVYDPMSPVKIDLHEVPDAETPDFIYDAMHTVPVSAHNTPAPYQLHLSEENAEQTLTFDKLWPMLSKMTTARKERLFKSIASTAISVLTAGMYAGKAVADIQHEIGEVALNALKPIETLGDKLREHLVQTLGGSIFEAICGPADDGLESALELIKENGYVMMKRETVAEAVENVMSNVVLPAAQQAQIAADVCATTIRDVYSVVDSQWNTFGTTFQTVDMLGSSGTEKVDINRLTEGLEEISKFSLQVNAIRALTTPLHTTISNVADKTSILLQEFPLMQKMPSEETDNWVIDWKVPQFSDTLTNIFDKFTIAPLSLSVEEQQDLCTATLDNVRVVSLKMPEISIAI